MTSADKILIVDDSEESLKLLSGILIAEGFDVRPADSGELALAAVSVSPPDLILLDMRMPGMNGLEVFRRLKSRPESRDIPVIFLSASHDFEDRLESLESGAVDFLNKPFHREELLARLKTHLELARLRKELERRVAERTEELQNANDQLEIELEARRRVEEILRESEHRFRSLADTTPAGICVFGHEGRLTYASQWFQTFVGSTMEQLASDDWFQYVHPEDSTFLREEITAAIQEQRSSQAEHRLLRHDGKYRWVAATANPRYIDGRFAGHTVILVDITELKRSQEEAVANQKLESLGVLSAGIAHDFNNLLSTILAHSDLALDEIPEESPARECVQYRGGRASRFGDCQAADVLCRPDGLRRVRTDRSIHADRGDGSAGEGVYPADDLVAPELVQRCAAYLGQQRADPPGGSEPDHERIRGAGNEARDRDSVDFTRGSESPIFRTGTSRSE